MEEQGFSLREIASVEVRNVGRSGKEVRIGLHDGSSIRYMTWNETRSMNSWGR